MGAVLWSPPQGREKQDLCILINTVHKQKSNILEAEVSILLYFQESGSKLTWGI
jgi:hypothetical protein